MSLGCLGNKGCLEGSWKTTPSPAPALCTIMLGATYHAPRVWDQPQAGLCADSQALPVPRSRLSILPLTCQGTQAHTARRERSWAAFWIPAPPTPWALPGSSPVPRAPRHWNILFPLTQGLVFSLRDREMPSYPVDVVRAQLPYTGLPRQPRPFRQPVFIKHLQSTEHHSGDSDPNPNTPRRPAVESSSPGSLLALRRVGEV